MFHFLLVLFLVENLFTMAQNPTTSIKIFSQGGNYGNGKCISISQNPGSDKERQIILMTQSNSSNNNNRRYFGKHTNMQGIPKRVFENSISPVRLAIKKYV